MGGQYLLGLPLSPALHRRGGAPCQRGRGRQKQINEFVVVLGLDINAMFSPHVFRLMGELSPEAALVLWVILGGPNACGEPIFTESGDAPAKPRLRMLDGGMSMDGRLPRL